MLQVGIVEFWTAAASIAASRTPSVSAGHGLRQHGFHTLDVSVERPPALHFTKGASTHQAPCPTVIKWGTGGGVGWGRGMGVGGRRGGLGWAGGGAA